LEVDGQVAFSDYLDEPDLSPRSREALARKLRRIEHDDQPPWLAASGAFSLIAGLALLAGSTYVWWLAAGDLIRSLFEGNPVLPQSTVRQPFESLITRPSSARDRIPSLR
jgi:hypothetical protein